MWVSTTLRRQSAAARTRRAPLAHAVVGVAIASLTCGALPAQGETDPLSGSNGPSCALSNPPNELTLSAGTPQTGRLGSTFETNLQVTFANSNGCPVTTPVAGLPVSFSAPSSGASGAFSTSDSNAVTVGSDAAGMAAAPAFTANQAAGTYEVTASSAYGSVSFVLTNVEANDSGVCSTAPPTAPAHSGAASRVSKLTVGVGARQATPRATRFPIRLAVTVTDSEKDPLPGVLVTFVAPSRGPSGRFTVRSGGSRLPRSHSPDTHTLHMRRVEVRSDTCGIALAPAFTANDRAGGYVVVASVERARAAFALVNETA